MPEHSKEPWRVEVDQSDEYVAVWSGDVPTGQHNGEGFIPGLVFEDWTDDEFTKDRQDAKQLVADLRRAAACVNACAGVPTEELGSLRVGDLLEFRDRAAEASQHRVDRRRQIKAEGVMGNSGSGIEFTEGP